MDKSKSRNKNKSNSSELLIKSLNTERCRWIFETDPDFNYWTTGCDNTFEFINEGIKENHFKYCPYCGKEILEIKNNQDNL